MIKSLIAGILLGIAAAGAVLTEIQRVQFVPVDEAPQTVAALDPVVRRCHLAWDIGAGALTEALAERLQATAVLQQYSRMVVDCNRQLLDPGAFLEFGDGVIINGNRNLRYEDKQARRQHRRAVQADGSL